jgi:ABC-type transporter Mla MlaB component
MSFESRSGLDLMTGPQDGRHRPASRRPGAHAREGDALRCDVTGVAADVIAVDVLARLALALRRRGERLELFGASDELRALVTFMGLAEALLHAELGPDAELGPT